MAKYEFEEFTEHSPVTHTTMNSITSGITDLEEMITQMWKRYEKDERFRKKYNDTPSRRRRPS